LIKPLKSYRNLLLLSLGCKQERLAIWCSSPFRGRLRLRIFQPSKITLDSSLDNARKDYMDVRVRLPIRMIHYMEELRKEWGLQSRSAVIERLIEVISEKE